MIVDRMERLENYRGLSQALDSLIDRIIKCNWCALPMGRTEIDGEKAYINHNVVSLKEHQPTFEMHRLYGDIHIIISGEETIGYAPIENISWTQSNDETLVATGRDSSILTLTQGMFAIFFPTDAHRPSQGVGTCEKLVGKFKL